MNKENSMYRVRKVLVNTTKVDYTTGELLDISSYTQDELIELRPHSLFGRCFYNVSGKKLFKTDGRPDILKEKSKESYGYYWLTLLLYFTEYQTNRLVKLDGDGRNIKDLISEPLIFSDLMNILNTSERTLYRFLSLCDEHKLIRKHDEQYFVNPYYGYKGKGIVPFVCTLFYDCERLNSALSDKHIKAISRIKKEWEALNISAKALDKDNTFYQKNLDLYRELEESISKD